MYNMKAITATIRQDFCDLKQGQEVKVVSVENGEACVITENGDFKWISTGYLVVDYNSI